MNFRIVTFVTVTLLIAKYLSAQTIDTHSVVYESFEHEVDSVGAYLTADSMPEFPEGIEGVYSFVQENLNVKYLNRVENSRIYVSFIVGKDGRVEDIQVVKSTDKRLSKVIVKILRKIPNWKPGEIGGKKVDVRLTLSFKY